MYIWTENHEIINFDHYARVDIHPVGEEYTLYIFVKGHRNVEPRDNGIVIAKFKHEVDAKYSRCLLFNALMDKAGVWDATAIVNISEIWGKVIKDMNLVSNVECKGVFHQDFLADAEIDITGLDEITITYSSNYDRNKILDDCKKLVEEKLKDELFQVDIIWEAIVNE